MIKSIVNHFNNVFQTPVLVLLDEATSALDSKTEKNIQESLSKVCAGKTTLIGNYQYLKQISIISLTINVYVNSISYKFLF